jgi:hypothetical protein
MAVTHLQRFSAHFDLYRSAVTSAFMRVRHEVLFRIWKPGSQE